MSNKINTARTVPKMEMGAYLLNGKNITKDIVLESVKSLDACVGISQGGTNHRYSSGRRTNSTSGQRDRYTDTSPNTSVRNQFTRKNYEYFRPSEAVAIQSNDILAQCMEAYRRVGLVRNIIDLMGDFCVKGVKITHPNSRIQKFYRGWFKKIHGPERSERAANLLYRCGVFIVKRTMAKINVATERALRTQGGDDTQLEPDEKMTKSLSTQKRNIPIRYNFLNPLTLEIIGGPLAVFVGKSHYALKVTRGLRASLNNPKTQMEKGLIAAMPAKIRMAIKKGERNILLDPNTIRALHYKKDDWNDWADPMIYSIMDDLILYEKMKLADLAALDGAISQIRVWKIGDLEKEIFPTNAAINKLADILLSNPGGGAFDVIWGPGLEVDEYKTNVHEFLGNEKYIPALNAIYAGLGVPPTLTGASTASGFTNNYISLQTLVQRLEYGRERLIEFWQQEIELVRQAMGFKHPARIEFDHMTLSDENAEKALLIQLVDRDVLTVETLLERFGECPEFEELRRRKEQRRRKSKLLPPKAGPWHTPEKVFELMKTALSRGFISPEQAGIDIPDDMKSEETPFEKQIKAKKAGGIGGNFSNDSDKKGEPQQGRPVNSKDSQKRQQKTVKPVGASIDNTAAVMTTMLWARDAQQSVADIVNSKIVKFYHKNNMRSLSANETAIAEQLKFAVLSQLTPFCDVTAEVLQPLMQNNPKLSPPYNKLYKRLKHCWITGRGRTPTMDETRSIQAIVYALLNSDAILLQ